LTVSYPAIGAMRRFSSSLLLIYQLVMNSCL